jgi:energy-converting hydrogenase Eha subunit H
MEDIMKKLLGAVSALALFASAGLAMAEDVTGTLLEIDEMAQTITLEDGTTYTVGEGVILEGFEPGQEVTVSLEEQEGQEVVIFIEPAMAEPDGDDEPVVD